MDGFAEGYDYFVKNAGAFIAGHQSSIYIDRIQEEINNFSSSINGMNGFKTPINKLKGNVAEHWHAGTFNINAAVNGSSNRATADVSNNFGSVDVSTSWGDNYGLKYYRTAEESAKQQAKSIFEKFKEYESTGGKDSFEKYCQDRGYSDDSIIHDPVYSGQLRLIPVEQFEDAQKWLEKKIAEESLTRPEQVKRYQDTLDFLRKKIEDGNGNSSIELTKKEAEKLAKLAEEGNFDPAEFGLTTEELIRFRNIMQQSFKAGLSSAVITMVMKTAPEIIKAINYLIETGELNAEQYKQIGLSAATGVAEGFIRGSISAALVTYCQSGLFGGLLKVVDPTVIGMVATISIDAIKNSFKVAKGEMSRYAMTTDLVREMFVGTCGLVAGAVSQCFIELPVFGFLIGNFIGTTIGSFTYNISYSATMAFCVDTGFTMFGLVDQKYELPKDVLQEIGIEVFDYQSVDYGKYDYDSFDYDRFEPDRFEPDVVDITFIRRGVIGVSQIGYYN